MNWDNSILSKITFDHISNIEEKQKVANKISEKVKDGDVIGFGSGTTSYLTAIAIAKKVQKEKIKITAIPTSYEIKILCSNLEIPTASLLEKKPNWSFDGADEVDNNNWLIKGRGAAMFKEKMNIANSPITYILIDKSKKVDKLCKNYKIPVEVYPEALNYVKSELLKIGASDITIRKAINKDGPIITENGNIILDIKFANITNNTEKQIKSLVGVIESGLFIGYHIESIME